ncbi:MAG: sensor histidine kinase [Promethearchaeota archaeon]
MEFFNDNNKSLEESKQIQKPLINKMSKKNLLNSSNKKDLDNNVIRLLELIKNGGKKSIKLIKKIVDISRIESKNFNLNKKTESLIDVITESVNDIMSKINKQNFNLNLDLLNDLYSEIDRLQIEQVIKELLLYIVKNSPKNGKISISLRENNYHAEIHIKNTGIKLIEQEKVKKFLNKNMINGFENYLNYSCSQESLYGLYFSKVIINLHGGQIILRTEENEKDSKFIIRLPIKNWADSLIHIYIIYKSGLLLHDHPFMERAKNYDSSLISGGIVGIRTLLKEIIQGEKNVRIIDHGDRKLIFETNKTNNIFFVLIVKENLIVFQRKLDALIEDFDKNYFNLVEIIEKSSCIMENWINLKFLILKHFRK